MSGKAKISPATGKALSKQQRQKIFKLINNGGSKKDIEMLYFSMTQNAMKEKTYKKLCKGAKKKKKACYEQKRAENETKLKVSLMFSSNL